MSSVQSLLHEASDLSSEDPRRDAEVLLGHCLERPRSWLYAWGDSAVDEVDAARYRKLLRDRQAGVPVAYLLGTREFWSLPLRVTPATLIPRPDTERLVSQALALALPDSARVLDLGTGSGAIALALASERPRWSVTAVDADAGAVAVALQNVASLAPGRVDVLVSDWFSALPGRRFDLVVANPPYVGASDPHLTAGDLRFEPRHALVSGDDGLEDLSHIVAQAPTHLVADGCLLLEHGFDQGAAVRSLLTEAGFAAVVTHRDFAGNERVSGGRWYAE